MRIEPLFYGYTGMLLLLLAGCRQQKTLPDEESLVADSIHTIDDEMDSLQQRADTDSIFHLSENYSQEMGRRAIARNKTLYRLSHAEKLLIRYEATAITLERLNQLIAHNSRLKKDVRLMTRIKNYGEQAYSLEQQLKDTSLSDKQYSKLKEIKDKIINSMN